jgi:hypothetical protein
MDKIEIGLIDSIDSIGIMYIMFPITPCVIFFGLAQ